MTPPVGSKFIHDALLYGSDEELIRTAIPFLTEGLAAGESGLVVCRQRTIDLLTRTIGRHPRLRVLPQARVYQRITSAIRSYRELVRRELAVGAWRVRLVGEVDFGTTTGEWAFWGEEESE